MAEMTAASRSRLKIFSWTGAALLALILLLLNFIVSYLPLRWDASENGIYSISKGTKEVLKKVEDTLVVRIMFSADLPSEYKLNEKYVRDLLLEYKRATRGKIRIEYLDPSKSPKNRQIAMEGGVAPVQLNVVARDRREVKECFMGISLLYGDKKGSLPVIQDAIGLEYQITQQIKKLVMPTDLHVGILSNGEGLGLGSAAIKELQGVLEQLYKVETLDLEKSDLPTHIKTIWLLGPEKEISAAVADKLRVWVANGGSLGLLLDHTKVTLQQFSSSDLKTGLEGLLKEWGIDFKQGVVFDNRCERIQLQTQQGMFRMINIVDYPYFPLISDLNRTHPTTKDLDVISMPFVAPFIIESKVPGLTYTSLARTSEESWLDTNTGYLDPMNKKSRPVDALKGPLDVALVIEGKFAPDATKQGRVLLFGTSRFIRNDYPPRQTNYNLFLNLVEWAGQDDALLSIRSKGASMRPIKNFSDVSRTLIKLMIIVTLPLLSIILGLVIWQREKIRRSLLPLTYADA